MATTTSAQPSFSPRRKWSIALSVTVATIAVLAVLVGVNYLSSRYFFHRFYLDPDTDVKLSPRTISVLKSLTNQVDVTIFYNKEDPIYPEIVSLLREYQAHAHKHLAFKTVDYYDPGAAGDFRATRPYLGSLTNRDFILFESEGRHEFVDGSWLKPYSYEFGSEESTTQGDPKVSLVRKQTVFKGEMLFTAKIFGVTQVKALKAYFLQGHQERSPTDTTDDGYTNLVQVFHRNHVETETLDNLLGTNTVPLDCNLLVIAGPQAEFPSIELDKIGQYLEQGGRLFALFDYRSVTHHLGLESVLAKWNVRVSHEGILLDPVLAIDAEGNGSAFAATNFAPHDVTKALIGGKLNFILPRSIERLKAPSQTGADEPQVTALAFSSAKSQLRMGKDKQVDAPSAPLMVAVEKGPAKGVVTERGTTRMLIVGDAALLDNLVIGGQMNEDFADAAINWLLERSTLVSGIGPRRITEYRIQMTPTEINTVKGLLLGAIPGGIFLLGGLVWLRRRK
jgi:hypothetical protein